MSIDEKVVIMMATYNGADYIKRQMDSILSQSYSNWEMYISDDSSNDGTLEILKKYKQKDNRIKKILVNNNYHGAFANYFNVMHYVKNCGTKYSYYFYCDQDDMWVKDKLEFEICEMRKIEYANKNIPVFCYSDLELVDSRGEKLNDRMSNHIKVQFSEKPYNIFFKEQYVWGTTMGHNSRLWDIMAIESPDTVKNMIPHDTYVSRYAAIYAKIKFIERPLVIYTRHGNNVTGIPGNGGMIKNLKKLTIKLPEVINRTASSYGGGLYLLRNIADKNSKVKELENCLLFGGVKARSFIRKYRLLEEEYFWGRCATKFILYTGVYRLSKSYRKYRELRC